MKEKPDVYIFFGLPGSGKGSLALKLSQALEIPHISSGHLLREEVQRDTPKGKLIKSYIDQGKFPPDELVVDRVIDRSLQLDCKPGFILDGLPRTVEQSTIIDKHLKESHRLIFINISVSEEVIIERLLGRRMCTHCSANFHIKYQPPLTENTCDHCSHSLSQRSDDKEDIIKDRFKLFHQHFSLMLEYYQGRDNWIEANTSMSPQECFEQLFSKLEPFTTLPANMTS